jgi:hypothetical protein
MSAFGQPVASSSAAQPQTLFGAASTAAPVALPTPAPRQPPPAQQQQQPNAIATPASAAPAASSTTTPAFAAPASGQSAAALKFRELAQQSQKLNESIRAGSADLPKLELSLGMIRDKARDMSRRAGGTNRENIQQAYFSHPFILCSRS